MLPVHALFCVASALFDFDLIYVQFIWPNVLLHMMSQTFILASDYVD